MSGIFICYRRVDTEGYAGRIYDRLADEFNPGDIFIDVDTIEPGDDFLDAIDQALRSVDVVLALIGPQWTASSDPDLDRLLSDPSDYVRVELEAALRSEDSDHSGARGWGAHAP